MGASHIFHPDSHTSGLYDACPRCEQHAKHPQESLDSTNLARLREGRVYTELDIKAAAVLAEYDKSKEAK